MGEDVAQVVGFSAENKVLSAAGSVPFVLFKARSWEVAAVSRDTLGLLGVAEVREIAGLIRAGVARELWAQLKELVEHGTGELRFKLKCSDFHGLDAWARARPSGWQLLLMPLERPLAEPIKGVVRRFALNQVFLDKIPTPACLMSPSGVVVNTNDAWRDLPPCQRGLEALPCSADQIRMTGCGMPSAGPIPPEKQLLGQGVPALGWRELDLGSCGRWRMLDGRAVGGAVAILFDLERLGRTGEHRLSLLEGIAQLSDGAQAARDEERKAVARELHDGLGQELAMLSLLSFGLTQAYSRSTNLAECKLAVSSFLGEFEQQLKRISEVSRAVSLGMRTEIVAEKGLQAACFELLKRFSEHTGIISSMQVMPLWQDPDEQLALHVFRCLQELLNNALRHAQATKVRVILAFIEHSYQLEVRDNGIGFAQPDFDVRAAKHLGMRNMRERAAIYEGELTLRTRPDIEGSSVKVFFRERRQRERPPLQEATRAALSQTRAAVLRHLTQQCEVQ